MKNKKEPDNVSRHLSDEHVKEIFDELHSLHKGLNEKALKRHKRIQITYVILVLLLVALLIIYKLCM